MSCLLGAGAWVGHVKQRLDGLVEAGTVACRTGDDREHGGDRRGVRAEFCSRRWRHRGGIGLEPKRKAFDQGLEYRADTVPVKGRSGLTASLGQDRSVDLSYVVIEHPVPAGHLRRGT